MVRCEQIAEYFQDSHKRIFEITSAYINRYKRYHINPRVLINEAYIYIHSKRNTITIEQIEPFTINWIRQQIVWTKQTVCERELIYEKPDVQISEIETDAIEHKKTIERKYQAIDSVYLKSGDMIKRRVHEVYFKKGINTVRKMAKHFDIPTGSAHELIVTLKRDINEQFKNQSRVSE